MAGDNVVAVPQRAAGAGDDLNAGLEGRRGDDLVASSGIRVGVPFEDQMGDFPCLEELGKERLWRLSQDEELGLGIEARERLGEVILTVEPTRAAWLALGLASRPLGAPGPASQELPPVGASPCAVDIMGIPGEDGPQDCRFQIERGMEGRRIVKTQVCAEPVDDTRLGHFHCAGVGLLAADCDGHWSG